MFLSIMICEWQRSLRLAAKANNVATYSFPLRSTLSIISVVLAMFTLDGVLAAATTSNSILLESGPCNRTPKRWLPAVAARERGRDGPLTK